jgi:hypothetical protein
VINQNQNGRTPSFSSVIIIVEFVEKNQKCETEMKKKKKKIDKHLSSFQSLANLKSI